MLVRIKPVLKTDLGVNGVKTGCKTGGCRREPAAARPAMLLSAGILSLWVTVSACAGSGTSAPMSVMDSEPASAPVTTEGAALTSGLSNPPQQVLVSEAATPGSAASTELADTAQLVATDLVGAFVAVDTRRSEFATGNQDTPRKLTMPEPYSRFGRAVARQLTAVGYTVTYLDLDGVSRPTGMPEHRGRVVQFRIASGAVATAAASAAALADQAGALERYSELYELQIGTSKLTRVYRRDAQGIYPVSDYRFAGISPHQLPAGDSRFVLTAAPAHATNPTGASAGANRAVVALAAPRTGGVQQLASLDVDTVATPPSLSTAPAELSPPSGSASLPDPATVERKNLYDTRVSNFGAFTQDYDAVERMVLIFGNDSLAITPLVRLQIQQLVARFEPESDVVSVIGCSHGKTALANGNKLLAIGRARRIREALVDAGVPLMRIHDEGCWAGVHFDEMMPRRGVVMELKRRQAEAAMAPAAVAPDSVSG